MSVTNLGDLSQSFTSRQRNVSLRQEIEKLTNELATGKVNDVRDVLAGNFNYLTDLERRTDVLQSYSVATTEATLYSAAVQDVLSIVEGYGSDLSGNLLAAGTSAIGSSGSDTASEARNALAGLIGTVNTKSAGRYLFSGTATDQKPLADAADVVDALRIALSGATTADDMLAAAQVWFDDPAGFEATVYQGSADALAPFDLSQIDQVSLDARATDPQLREVIKLTALAALADDPTFGLDLQGQSELFDKTGKALLVAQDGIIAMRATVGFTEGRIEKISARNAAELTSIEFAKSALLEVDPFEAATRLEEAQFQLQSLYSVTVRMSQLSLVNFL
ncbi:MAG: flagellin [Sulfitobacter sp.]